MGLNNRSTDSSLTLDVGCVGVIYVEDGIQCFQHHLLVKTNRYLGVIQIYSHDKKILFLKNDLLSFDCEDRFYFGGNC